MERDQFKQRVKDLLDADGGIYELILNACMLTVAGGDVNAHMEKAEQGYKFPKEVLTAVLSKLSDLFEPISTDGKENAERLRSYVKFSYFKEEEEVAREAENKQ